MFIISQFYHYVDYLIIETSLAIPANRLRFLLSTALNVRARYSVKSRAIELYFSRVSLAAILHILRGDSIIPVLATLSALEAESFSLVFP